MTTRLWLCQCGTFSNVLKWEYITKCHSTTPISVIFTMVKKKISAFGRTPPYVWSGIPVPPPPWLQGKLTLSLSPSNGQNVAESINAVWV
jgi:hypothetical protein